jgi:hypothetical protein
MEHSILDLNREIVLSDYQSATVKNKELFITGDVNASSEYIFDNQKKTVERYAINFTKPT